MRNVVRSEGYARVRVGIGLVGAVLGLILIVRTISIVGLRFEALASYVLGAALIALGFVRWREYRSVKGKP